MNMNIDNIELSTKVYNDFVNGISQQLFVSDEEKLAYLIIKQRLANLYAFLEKQKQKYNISDDDVEELKELWFLYNDLKELHFIGTDIYSDALFVRHKTPFLYRSVGKDCNTKRVLNKKNSSDEIGSTLIKECLEQIKSGGQGELFSYSKCFGKMLIKYANIVYGRNETTLEIRKNSWINSIIDDKGDKLSIQKYIRMTSELNQEIEIPLFLIDMSNARENEVKNLKSWIDTYLGEQSYTKRYNDIYDPIGDAEVVANFTGDLCDDQGNYIMCDEECRYTLNIEEFCCLLYKYAVRYAEENRITRFGSFISQAIGTIPNHETNMYFSFYNNIVNGSLNCPKIDEILRNIDWENEKKYMTRVKAEESEKNIDWENKKRVKAEESETNKKISEIRVYKEADVEIRSGIWKKIVFTALRGKCPNCEKVI